MRMRASQLARLALVAGAVAVTVAACGKAEARMCRQSSEAEFCLVEDEQGSYTMTGHGFKPDSEVHINVEGGPPQADAAPKPMPAVHAGHDGRFPGQSGGGGVAAVIPASYPQRVTVTGTASTGGEARFEFTVPPVKR